MTDLLTPSLIESISILRPLHRFGTLDVDQGEPSHDRSGLRYETDLTDDGWAEIASLIPPAKPGGNKRSVNLRQVVNGLMYILSTGCQWRAIPKDLTTRSAVYHYFDRCSWDGTLWRIHHALHIKCREEASRQASPNGSNSLVRRASRAFRRAVPTPIRMGESAP
jgi:transposase